MCGPCKIVKSIFSLFFTFNSTWNRLRDGKEDKHRIARLLFVYNCLGLLVGFFFLFFVMIDIPIAVVRVIPLLVGLSINWEAVVIYLVATILIILTSGYGVYGAFFEDRISLVLFFIGKVLILLACIIGPILADVYSEKAGGKILNNLYTTLNTTYGFEDFITNSWDDMQSSFHCCGVEGDVNSTTSWEFYKTTPWFFNKTIVNQFVPASCWSLCVGGIMPETSIPVHTLQLNKYLYTDGCYDVMMDYFNAKKFLFIGILVVVLCLMVLSLVGAILIYKRNSKNKKPETERLILHGQNQGSYQNHELAELS